MKDSKLIDPSVWPGYLFNGRFTEVIDSDEIIFLSALSLFEIKKKLMKSRVETAKITKSMEFIKKRSLIIPVSGDIAKKAVELSLEKGLPIIDSVIYTTSVLNNAYLITLDNDFRGLKNAIVLQEIK